jgi:hypothetical protein
LQYNVLFMPEEKDVPDLVDLKFLPAWVKETPNENRYADFTGDESGFPQAPGRPRPAARRGERRDRGPRPSRGKHDRPRRDERDHHRGAERPRLQEERLAEFPAHAQLPALTIRFLPDGRVLESVLAQIKAGHVAYSVFSLARLFLTKPERYDVRLKAESGELFQLGENGAVSGDRRMLENSAFMNERDHFYRRDVTQSEPIKGNFNSVARCRLSGVLLGPTNYHAYQSQLRNLYEQRFSRRMPFPDYQRQIEIVSDPEILERWKEEARSVTTYTTLLEDPPLTFRSASETERHFRQTYLPGLLQTRSEVTLDGVLSRSLRERSLGRAIENAWAEEYRSPMTMMQELSNRFRPAGLHIFRHRKGMLFVTPIWTRPFAYSPSAVSASIAGIVAALTETPGLNRKQLLEKLAPGDDEEARERTKRALASDLHWLIGEGCVIEFNDGALALPRARAAAPTPATGLGNGQAPAATVPNEHKTSAEVAAGLGANNELEQAAPESIPPEPASDSALPPTPESPASQ